MLLGAFAGCGPGASGIGPAHPAPPTRAPPATSPAAAADPDSDSGLEARLRSPDPAVRIGAIDSAPRLPPAQGARAVPVLIALLGDETPASGPAPPGPGLEPPPRTVAAAAARALARVGGPAVPALVEALKNWNARRREGAATALGRVRDARALDPLIEAAATDSSVAVRDAAVAALGSLGDARAVPALIAALKDPAGGENPVRGEAMEALGKIGTPPAVEALRGAVEQSRSQDRLDAVEALGRVRTPAAAEALLGLLNHSWKRGEGAAEAAREKEDERVRQEAARLLVERDDARRDPRLAAYLLRTAGVEFSRSPDLLVKLGDPRAAGRLIELLDDPSPHGHVAAAACRALAALGEKSAAGAVARLLRDKRPALRQTAAEALGALRDENSVGPLLEAVTDRDPAVRAASVRALGQTGAAEPRVIETLIDAMEEDAGLPPGREGRRPDSQRAAAQALELLTGQPGLGTDPARWRGWWEGRRRGWKTPDRF